MATLSELRTSLRRQLGETTSHHWPDATLNEFIFESMRQVAIDCPVCYTAEWTAGSVAGQRDYVMPSSFLPPLWSVVCDYELTTERELPYLPPERAAAYNSMSSGTSRAYTYLHKQGELVIRILPSPGLTTFLVHAARIPSTLTDSESCPMNPIVHDAVVSFAKARAWEEWEQFDYSMRAYQEYEGRMARAKRLLGAVLIAYPISASGSVSGLPNSERDE